MRCCVFHTYVIPAIGPGGNTSQRVSDHILNESAANDFTLEKVFLGTPHWILTALYILGIVPAVAGLDISDIGTAASALVLIMLIVMLLVSLRLRYTMQSTFAHAPLRIPTWLHWTLTVVGTTVSACQIVLLAADFTPVVWIALGVWLATGTLMAILRYPVVDVACQSLSFL